MIAIELLDILAKSQELRASLEEALADPYTIDELPEFCEACRNALKELDKFERAWGAK
jgi:histidine ammonia-lyase